MYLLFAGTRSKTVKVSSFFSQTLICVWCYATEQNIKLQNRAVASTSVGLTPEV